MPVAGILLKMPVKSLRDKISLGASWRRGQKVHHAWGDMNVTIGTEDREIPGKPLFGFPLINTLMGGIVGFQPMQVTGAIAMRPLRGLLIAADVT